MLFYFEHIGIGTGLFDVNLSKQNAVIRGRGYSASEISVRVYCSQKGLRTTGVKNTSSTVLKFKDDSFFTLLEYLQFSVLLLLLHYLSEANIVLFAPLKTFDNFSD